jgi:hypothetical protein
VSRRPRVENSPEICASRYRYEASGRQECAPVQRASRAYHLLRAGIVFSRIGLASMLVLVVATNTIGAAQQHGRKAFVTAWRDQQVVVKRPLYSLVYSERTRFLPIARKDGRISGLTVATPNDTYYQFEARRDYEEAIVARTPEGILAAMETRYRRSAHLDEGYVQDVEPGMLVRYESGVKLVVGRVEIERDLVRLFLRRAHDHEVVTTLTVKLGGPVSTALVEAPLIESVLNRFVTKQ